MLIDMAKLERTRAARAGARINALASLAFLAAASLTFAPAFAQTGPAATAAPGPVPGAESAAAKPRAVGTAGAEPSLATGADHMHSLNTVPQPKRPFGLARIGALFSAAIVAGSLAAAVQAAGAAAVVRPTRPTRPRNCTNRSGGS